MPRTNSLTRHSFANPYCDMNGTESRFGYASNRSGTGSGASYSSTASQGFNVSFGSPSEIDLAGDISAFRTPSGDQLNLYRNALRNFGNPPQ